MSSGTEDECKIHNIARIIFKKVFMLAEFESECSCPQNVLSTYSVRGILLKVLK